MIFRKMYKDVLGMTAAACFALAPLNSASAESVLLDNTKLLYQGQKVDVNLYGEKLDNGYAYDLLLVLKRNDGSVITGYRPDIKGGYAFDMQAVKLKNKDDDTEQLVMLAKQGDWHAYSEYRVYDFADAKKVKELFHIADSAGLIVYSDLQEDTLYLKTVKDKEPVKVKIDAKVITDVAENRRQVHAGKLFSLAVVDVDGDGKQELITDQQITVDKAVLADVGAVWRYIGPQTESKKPAEEKAAKAIKAKSTSVDDIIKAADELIKAFKPEETAEKKAEKLWRQDNMTVMKNAFRDKRNTVNKGAFFSGGMIYPVKMVSPQGEATYPQFAYPAEIELKNAWNALLRNEVKANLQDFFAGKADTAFQVLRADDKLISIQLISGKTSFTHHNINLDPDKKEKLALKDLLDVKNKKLVELLNLLNTNKKITFDKDLTDEWYIVGEKLFLMKNIEGIDEVAVFELADLHKFVKLKNFVVNPKAE